MSDDFNDGNTAGWTVLSQAWNVVNGQLHTSDTSGDWEGSIIARGSAAWTDYKVSIQWQFDSAGSMGIYGRSSSQVLQGYAFGIEGSKIQLFIADLSVLLDEAVWTPPPSGTWINMTLAMAGNSIVGLIDGEQMVSASDSTYRSGLVLLGIANVDGSTTASRDFYFDDVYVTTYTGDAAPPGSVTNLQASAGDKRADLSWTKPADSDLAGVILVRRTGQTPNAGPVDGVLYAVGGSLGGGTLVYKGTGTSYANTGLTNGETYYYEAWAYDTSLNYSRMSDSAAAMPSASLAAVKVASVSSPQGSKRYVAGAGIPDVFVTYTAQISGPATSVTFSLVGMQYVDTNPADGWSALFNVSQVSSAASKLTVVAAGAGGQSNPYLYNVNLISLPTWFYQDRVTYTPAFSWQTGYRFDVAIDDLNLGFGTPSTWVLEEPVFGTTVLDLADKWTGFKMGPRFTLQSSLSGTVTTSNLGYYLGARVLDWPIFEYTLPFGKSGTFSFSVVSGSYSTNLSLTFKNDLTWNGITGKATVTLSAEKTIPLGNVRLPLAQIPGIMDIVLGASARVSLSLQANVQPYLNIGGTYGWSDVSITPSVLVAPKLYGEVQAFGGLVGRAGASVEGTLIQSLTASYQTGSGWSYSAPGSLEISGKVYASANLYIWKPEWDYDLFHWSVANWDFLAPPGTAISSSRSQGTYDGSRARSAKLASDGQGSVTAVYAGNPEIYVQVRNADGLWTTVAPLTVNESMEQAPAIAYDQNGRPYVVWVQSTIPIDQQDQFTLAQRAASQQIHWAWYDGTLWHESALTSDALLNAAPSIAFSPQTNEGLMVWERGTPDDTGVSADNLDIVFSCWDGSSWSQPQDLSSNSYAEWGGQVTYLGNGRPVVVWMFDADGDYVASREPNPTTGVAYAVWDGSAWQVGTLVADGGSFNQWAQAIRLPDGTIEAYWVAIEDDGYALYRRLYDGSQWSSATRLLSGYAMISSPSLAADAVGTVSMVYVGNDGRQNDLYVVGSDSAWSNPQKLTDDSWVQHDTSAVRDASNRLTVRVVQDDFLDTGTSASAQYVDQRAGTFQGAVALRMDEPVTRWRSGNVEVLAYQVTGQADFNPADIRVTFGTNSTITSITLAGTRSMAGLGLVITGARSVGSITDSRTGTIGDLAFIGSDGPVGRITLKGGLSGANLNGIQLGNLVFAADVDGDGLLNDATSLYIGSGLVLAVDIGGTVKGDVVLQSVTTLVMKRAFGADLWLLGGGVTATQSALGTASFLGGITGGTWDITGKVGTVTVTGTVDGWALEAGSAMTLNLSDVASADIVITGVLGSVTAKRWQAGQIQANSLGTLNVTGAAATTGSPAVLGDFLADLTLLGQSLASTASTLGAATIKGNVGANVWDVKGKVGSVTVGGAVGTADAAWQLKNATAITTLNLGDVTSADVTTPGAIGTVTAKRWQAGKLEGATLSSLSVQGGGRGSTLAGDFGANLTLTGLAGGNAWQKTLSSARIDGSVRGGQWQIAGSTGALTLGHILVPLDLPDVASISTSSPLLREVQGGSPVGLIAVEGANAMSRVTAHPLRQWPRTLCDHVSSGGPLVPGNVLASMTLASLKNHFVTSGLGTWTGPTSRLQPGLMASFGSTTDPTYKFVQNVAFIYDNSLAIEALLSGGSPDAESKARAFQIADALVLIQDRDPMNANVAFDSTYTTLRPAPLRDAYLAGLVSTIRPASNNTSSGNQAYVAMALLHATDVAAASGDTTRAADYLRTARELLLYVGRNRENSGLLGGFSMQDAAVQSVRACEHNIDLATAFERAASTETDAALKAQWQAWRDRAEQFRAAMYGTNPSFATLAWIGDNWSYFRAGTWTGDDINMDLVPIDTGAWSTLGRGDNRDVAFDFLEFWATSRDANGQTYTGFDPGFRAVLDETLTSRRDGIGSEATAYMILVARKLGDAAVLAVLPDRSGLTAPEQTAFDAVTAAANAGQTDHDLADYLIGQLCEVQLRAANTDGLGLVAAPVRNVGTGEYSLVNGWSLASTAWARFAYQGWNMFTGTGLG